MIYDCTYDFLDQNCLLNGKQSGFRSGDFYIHELAAITHNMFVAITRNSLISLSLSKAFDKVWHKHLIHTLKNNGIDGNLLTLIKSFLHNRYQKVVLNGQSSKWQNVYTGVQQGSVLGPLFFLICINKLPQGLHSDVKVYDQVGIKLLTRLRLEFNHLCEHKFWHNFKDTFTLLGSCSIAGQNNIALFPTMPVFQGYLRNLHEWLIQ